MDEQEYNEIMSLTPGLPDDFISMCRNLSFWEEYLFVWHDSQRRKTAYCSKCGRTFNIDISIMQTVTPAARELYGKKHNDYCRCPSCAEHVRYRDRYRGRGVCRQENYLYYFQPLSGGGLILRAFYLLLDFEDQLCGEMSYSESERIYFTQDKAYRFRRVPEYYNPFLSEYDWYNSDSDDSGFYWSEIKKLSTPKPWANRSCGCFKGAATWVIDKNALDGDFRYSCLKEYITCKEAIAYRNAELFTVAEYLCLFQKNPSLIEKMMKQDLKPLIYYHLQNQSLRFMINFKKPDFYSASGLSRGSVKNLVKDKGTFILIRSVLGFQLSERYGVIPQNALYFANTLIHSEYEIRDHLKYIKTADIAEVNRNLKYFRKQRIIYKSDYDNYLKQLEKLKMPKSEENLYPRDFHEAHRALSAELTRRANAKKEAERKRQEKRFAKKFNELFKELYYEKDGLFIRPAKGDGELLAESNALSHCVYSCYREKYRNGYTVICFIRRKERPDEPFYTLEITPKFDRIIQCRGKGNCGMTDEVKEFRDAWFDRLQSGIKEDNKKCRKTA